MFNYFVILNNVIIHFLTFCKGLMRQVLILFVGAPTLKVTVPFFCVEIFRMDLLMRLCIYMLLYFSVRLDLQLYDFTRSKDVEFFLWRLFIFSFSCSGAYISNQIHV